MYSYDAEKKSLYTEKGLRLYTAIRDQVLRKLNISGAITMEKAVALPDNIGAASSWEMMACIDFMAENGDIKEIPTTGFAQNRIFVKGDNHA